MLKDRDDAGERLRDEHRPEAIASRLARGGQPSYLRDLVLGAMDGPLTTFAIAAGAHGAGLSTGVVLIVGAANLLAEGFSMGVGNFLGCRAEHERRERVRREEEEHLRLIPEGEREEVRQIFAAKGFSGKELEGVVDIVTADRGLWVETMLREEYGFPAQSPSPWRAGAATFAAFLVVGALPLAPFAFSLMRSAPVHPFFWSAAMSASAFFGIGVLKGVVVGRAPSSSGLETLALGGAAAALAYTVGALLRGLAA